MKLGDRLNARKHNKEMMRVSKQLQKNPQDWQLHAQLWYHAKKFSGSAAYLWGNANRDHPGREDLSGAYQLMTRIEELLGKEELAKHLMSIDEREARAMMLNAGTAEGIREATRISYRQNRKQALLGTQESDFSPHVTGLLGAMASRLAVINKPVNPTVLWHETAPFAVINDEEVAVETLAEYAVYIERTVDTKLAGLRETVNSWIRRSTPDDLAMPFLTNPFAESCRWWVLLEPDVVELLRLERTDMS